VARRKLYVFMFCSLFGCREGRAGGYKEFDEAEIEETKRRRRELEEVCAVCYQTYVTMFGLKISACGLL